MLAAGRSGLSQWVATSDEVIVSYVGPDRQYPRANYFLVIFHNFFARVLPFVAQSKKSEMLNDNHSHLGGG